MTLRRDPRLRLVVLSFLMLLVELALIRWLGENVVYLSFFTNFVLLGSFLGIGLGFLSGHRRGGLTYLPAALFILVAGVSLFPVEIDRSGSEVIYFGRPDIAGLPIWLMLPLVFIGVVSVLFLIAQAVAREFKRFPPLTAYRLDIMGSILGVVTFTLLSWFRTPPVAWGLIVMVVVLWLAAGELGLIGIAMLAGIVLALGAQSLAPHLEWSPYYKIEAAWVDDTHLVSVNGIPHQEMTTVDLRRQYAPQVFVPYQLGSGSPDRVMVVGAGTGNDVSIALTMGAQEVDAVEIDPALYELGFRQHPESPYSDPRVNVIVDDGRAFMERSGGGYDLILFALPDSLTLVPGASTIRLESFLFTQEAIDRAHELLAPSGVFAMYNFYREEWLIDRLASTLAVSSGATPCVLTPDGSAGLALLASGEGVWDRCPVTIPRDLTGVPEPVTDDYPFLYIRSAGIPQLYLIALGTLLLVSLLALRSTGTSIRSVGPNLDLFLMGVAFMLLETKSIVQFALWFGTTWRVNALVFTGILLSVLAAIEVARARRLPSPVFLYTVLLLAVAASWAIPPDTLLELPTVPRFIAAILVTFTPVFIANLVFAQRFANTSNSTTAFGVNLLGAMVGGVLEYTSLLLGYRSLALLVAVLYLGALVAWKKMTGASLTARLGDTERVPA